jgi:hypothetical protein
MKSFKDIVNENVKPVDGLPQSPIDIGNGKKYVPSPNQKIRDLAKSYMRSKGMKYNPPKTFKKVDPERGKRIASEYDLMKHDPNHPDVKASYEALAKETMDQFHHITKHGGLNVDFMKPGQADPYEKTPHLGAVDVRDNNHLHVFPTEQGFGSGEGHNNHPMLAKTGVKVNGHEMLVNDAFRAVHDYFGHHKEGFGFGPSGEENAWRQHVSMYSPLARGAMTSETRGQNSFVNYGPNAAHNKKASPKDTIYADQKAGFMPSWTNNEGVNYGPSGEENAWRQHASQKAGIMPSWTNNEGLDDD